MSRHSMTVSADFNPEMLSLARNSRHLTKTQLAKRASVTLGTISKYESGTLPVNIASLTRLAEILDYPVTFFCRKPILIGAGGGSIFHRKQQRVPTKKLYEAYALAETRRLEISTMLASLDFPLKPPVEYDVMIYDDDPEKIARSVRAAMNIPPGPIFNLTETLERNGYVILAHDFGSSQIDGFSQRPSYPPCFLHINSQLPPDRWRWTLAHELGHLVMHFDPMEVPKLVEQQAHLFAAELLAPAHEIGHRLNDLTFPRLGALKRTWGISMQALITRAHHLGTISARQRQSMFVQLSKAGYRTREPDTLDPPVEKPTLMTELAQKHLVELEYSQEELRELLRINESDFRRHYISVDEWDEARVDILDALGIDDIIRRA